MNEDPAAGGLPRGVTPPSGRGGRFLSDVIVELGFADRETVEQAFEESRAPGKKLGTTLVEMGILSEHELGRAIAERYRLDYLDLEEFEIDPEAAQVIGDKEMKRYETAPVAFTEDGALVVAMVDPADWLAAEEIAQLTGRRVRRAVASAAGVARVIARVAEANANGEESAADAFEDSAAPARLTLRRVAHPLMGGATPPAPSPAASQSPAESEPPAAPPGVPATPPEQHPPELADVDGESPFEEGAPAEEPTVDWPEDGSATPAEELAAPEAVVGIATGPPTEAPEEHVHAGFGTEEKAEPTPSGSDVSQIWAGEEPAKVDDPETDAPSAIEAAEPQTEAAEAPLQIAAEASGAIEPAPSVEVVAEPGAVIRDGELDQARRDLAATRAELEGTRAERSRLDTELQSTRSELANTRSELTSARGRLDAVLKRTADAEHGLGEARADVSRLEAELVAARDQADSLRAEVGWTRQQLEQKAEREDQVLADLRERIEVMQAPATAPAELKQPAPVSAEPTSPPVPAPPSSPGSNGTEPPPRTTTPAGANGHPGPVRTPQAEAGTVKTRGLKRLIAAVRRL